MQRFGLAGRKALVTGASNGMGLCIAEAYAELGASVVINGRDHGRLEAAQATLAKKGYDVHLAVGDLRRDTDEIVETAASHLGGLDILTHCAGLRDRRATEELDRDAFSAMLDANLTAVYALVRASLPHLKTSNAARVILLTSIAANVSRAKDPAYAAAKGGLAALTRSLAVELGSDTLTVNAIAPGMFATDVNAHMVDAPEIKQFVDIRVPLKRWGRPEEIASAAVFLALPASSYVNGTTITVDGGLSVQM